MQLRELASIHCRVESHGRGNGERSSCASRLTVIASDNTSQPVESGQKTYAELGAIGCRSEVPKSRQAMRRCAEASEVVDETERG